MIIVFWGCGVILVDAMPSEETDLMPTSVH